MQSSIKTILSWLLVVEGLKESMNGRMIQRTRACVWLVEECLKIFFWVNGEGFLNLNFVGLRYLYGV